MPRPSRHQRNRSETKFGRQSGNRAPRGSKADNDTPGTDLGVGPERLQKVLASAGVASRRECEQLILEGRVEVDHQIVTELGTRVDPQRHEIRVDGEALSRPKLVYYAVNKPAGSRVIDLLSPNSPRAFCVGRLDISSEGLILVTNDGELANGLTHPRHGVEKIYHVQVAGQVEPEVISQLRRGMHLAEGFANAKHVRIKSRRKRSTILEMVLDEGRNREIRRLLARVGHKVQRLKRVAVGPVRLGELPTGAVRPLMRKEIQSLQRAMSRGRTSRAAGEPSGQESDHPRRRGTIRHKGHGNRSESRTVID